MFRSEGVPTLLSKARSFKFLVLNLELSRLFNFLPKVAVPVDRPVAVPVPKPYAVEVAKPVAVPVDRPVPYPVHVPVVKHVPAPYAVEVPQHYSVPVVKQVAALPYSQPLVVDKYPGLAAYSSW
jgi:hypothetical protein